MIYVFEKGNIVYDGSTITDEQKTKAVAVEALPKPDVTEGKIAVLRANKATETVYYEYIDAPIDPISEIISEPVDEEKAYLSEAVIHLSGEIEVLKQKISMLEGVN